MNNRVLHIIGNLGQGGVQKYLISYLKNLDRGEISFDFVVQTNAVGDLEEEARRLGANVFHLPSSIGDRKRFRTELSHLLREKKYSVVEAHQNHRSLFPLSIARSCGVPRRIVHSHNSYPAASIATQLYRIYFRRRIETIASDYWGCSVLANNWLYGKHLAKKALVIPNAIDVDKFVYSKSNREQVRKELDIYGLCIGHVGAGGVAKNYPYVIRCFDEIVRREPRSKLLLVGCSPESQNGAIGRLVEEKGISDRVIMTGIVSNPERYLSAMDAFIFPSHSEGLPIALVEAQANGLRPIAAEGSITDEVNVTGEVLYLQTSEDNLLSWVDAILERSNSPRNEHIEGIAESGYEIKLAAKNLQSIYSEMMR